MIYLSIYLSARIDVMGALKQKKKQHSRPYFNVGFYVNERPPLPGHRLIIQSGVCVCVPSLPDAMQPTVYFKSPKKQQKREEGRVEARFGLACKFSKRYLKLEGY